MLAVTETTGGAIGLARVMSDHQEGHASHATFNRSSDQRGGRGDREVTGTGAANDSFLLEYALHIGDY